MIQFPKYFLPIVALGLMSFFVLLFLAYQNQWEIGRLDVLVELLTLPAIAAVPVLLILGSVSLWKHASQRTAANLVGVVLLLINVLLIALFTYLS